MRTYVVAVAALVVIASSLGVPVGATPIAAPHALDGGALALAQPAQFFHLGKPYCWYQYGWAGPAWYWCGYGTRIGLGWGGVYGGMDGWCREATALPGWDPGSASGIAAKDADSLTRSHGRIEAS